MLRRVTTPLEKEDVDLERYLFEMVHHLVLLQISSEETYSLGGKNVDTHKKVHGA